MQTFSDRLRQRANELGFSQRSLARAVGLSHTHISRLFDGSRASHPAYSVVLALADVLGVPDRWLFFGDSFGTDEHNPNHNKNVALSYARAGGVAESVLSKVAAHRTPGDVQPSVLWWINQILLQNALEGRPAPSGPSLTKSVRVDNVSVSNETALMDSKGFRLFIAQLSTRGAQARVAKLLGVRSATISQIKRRRSCGVDLILRIQKELNIPVEAWREPVDTSPAEAAR